jgi:hypothetical protein
MEGQEIKPLSSPSLKCYKTVALSHERPKEERHEGIGEECRKKVKFIKINFQKFAYNHPNTTNWLKKSLQQYITLFHQGRSESITTIGIMIIQPVYVVGSVYFAG